MSPSEARIADPYRDELKVDLRDPVDLSFGRRVDTPSTS
jgi:hypothetical protein